MASYDVKALSTNVEIEGTMEAVTKVLNQVSDSDLPVIKADFVKLISLCINFNCFTFNIREYIQLWGLAMGSPLSAIMANLYMETLEVDQYIRIMRSGAFWYRYIDVL
ncbi:uncharacterized protein LOC143039092 [Oratosquilla oratoria]|uniref:uncharacterized protein LOC143039092 n=1 Tax=Oratosquilla oratoria TaxID=337810 RepID=UPI003F777B15